MKPEDLAKAGTEFAHQCAVFCWTATVLSEYPELEWLHAIKNEEKSGNVVRGTRAKQSGIKKGVSDILLPVRRGNFSGLYIEMKKPGKLKAVTVDQLKFGAFVQSQGFGFIVCDHWEKARDVLIEYLNFK